MTPMEVGLQMIEGGILSVDQEGRVWRHKVGNRGGWRPIEAKRAEHQMQIGYLGVKVHWHNKQHLLLAHRLVWTVLRGTIPPGLEINHIDGRKANNHPSNLELVTGLENKRHAIRTGLTPPPDPLYPKISRQAVMLRRQGHSYSKIAAMLGVSQTTAFRAVTLAPP